MVSPGRFILLLLVVLAIVFSIHLLMLYWAGLQLWDNLIVLCYVLNCTLAALIFYVLHHFRNKLSNAIGYLFMGGSLLKFVVFFLVFYPIFKEDGEVSKLEFASFFVPYLVSLCLETFYSAKMLNQLNPKKD